MRFDNLITRLFFLSYTHSLIEMESLLKIKCNDSSIHYQKICFSQSQTHTAEISHAGISSWLGISEDFYLVY